VGEEAFTGEREEVIHYTSEGTAKSLRDELLLSGITSEDIAELHGDAKHSAQEAMADFQSGKRPVMIATIESGGTGINLDDIQGDRPRTMIIMTAPFGAVDNVQAIGRVWRLTTKSNPEIKYIFTDSSVDKWNAAIIAAKMKALGATVKGEVGRLNIDPDVLEFDPSVDDVEALDKERQKEIEAEAKKPKPPPPVRPPPTREGMSAQTDKSEGAGRLQRAERGRENAAEVRRERIRGAQRTQRLKAEEMAETSAAAGAVGRGRQP
jgi:hypothetical protein